MSSKVKNPLAAAALDAIAAGFDQLAAAGAVPGDGRDAIVFVREVEVLRRRADASAVALLGEIDAGGLFREDGHGSAKIMVRHIARLSNGEAAARNRTARVCRVLPEVDAAYRAGEIGTCHVRLLGSVHANPRVREAMAGAQGRFVRHALASYRLFRERMQTWVDATDVDGPAPGAERSHLNRNAQLIQDFNKSWDLKGSFGSLQGATLHDIFDHYVNAEREADWAAARAEHGDAVCADHLTRTESQRRADALQRIFEDAATNPESATPPGWCHNMVWDPGTFEEMFARYLGAEPTPFDPDRYRCETLTGIPIDPNEAIINAIISQVRRVVLNARSTVIDLGEARYFVGNARHAVHLASSTCVWPGCHTPSTACEADHLTEHSRGGRTDPGNGAPLCGKHNRHKQKGFTIWRDPDGAWHTYRPDHTEVPSDTDSETDSYPDTDGYHEAA